MNKQDGFGHEHPYEGKTNDWITPNWIIKAFNTYAQSVLSKSYYFDLDPCSSINQPWSCANKSYTIKDDGLTQKWFGNVWCNPPYGPHTKKWIKRLSEHGIGIALIYARVETRLWHEMIFPTASGYIFPNKRIKFILPNGQSSKSTGGAPSALISWGDENKNTLISMVKTGVIAGVFMECIHITVR